MLVDAKLTEVGHFRDRSDKPAMTEAIVSSVDGFIALRDYQLSYFYFLSVHNARLSSRDTDWIRSWESTEGTNSLLMKRPVGTVIVLLSFGTWIVTLAAMMEV